MSEKYYIEQGTEQDHFFIEHEWHVICTVNTQLECICLGKGEAELICRLLNEEEKRKSLPKIDKNIKAELIKAFNIKSKHSEFEEINNKWKQIVKAIELLECE